jgi:hypothetical protein
MKPSAVTIDAIDIAVHKRYAEDQALLDPAYIKEPSLVAPHPEIFSLSSLYSSKWEELFEVHRRSSSWAAFTSPISYNFQSKRLFSYCLMPNINFSSLSDRLEKDVPSLPSLYETRPGFKVSKEEIMSKIKSSLPDLRDAQEESLCITALLDKIEDIDKMLAMIHGRKAQQKG